MDPLKPELKTGLSPEPDKGPEAGAQQESGRPFQELENLGEVRSADQPVEAAPDAQAPTVVTPGVSASEGEAWDTTTAASAQGARESVTSLAVALGNVGYDPKTGASLELDGLDELVGN